MSQTLILFVAKVLKGMLWLDFSPMLHGPFSLVAVGFFLVGLVGIKQ
jgi:hypothetical protein